MANELVVRNAALMNEQEFEQVQRVAKMFSVSALFAAKGDDPRAIAETAVKIMAGREIGLGPFASVQNIQVIHGNPTFSGHMIASAIKGSGKYDYRIVKWTDKECSIQFFEGGDKVGDPLSYTMQDAQNAQLTGKDVWKKFPRAMLFNRAISAGYRAYCPDVLGGMRAYTPEELGAQVDGEGQAVVVNGKVVVDDSDTVDGSWSVSEKTQSVDASDYPQGPGDNTEPTDAESTVDDENFDDLWEDKKESTEAESTVDDDFSPYANALMGPYEISPELQGLLMKYKKLHDESGRAMNKTGWDVIVNLLVNGGNAKLNGESYTISQGFINETEVADFIETLCQSEVDGIPGAGIGKPLLEDMIFKGPEIDGVVSLMREVRGDVS